METDLSWLMSDEDHEFNSDPKCPNCLKFMRLTDCSSFGEVLLYECEQCSTTRIIGPDEDN